MTAPYAIRRATIRHCAHCGRPLLPGQRADAVYCSRACKEARRARRRAQA